MALEYDTQKLYEFYKSNPRIKRYINSLPTDMWLPELQNVYDAVHSNNRSQLEAVFAIAAATIFIGALYLL